MIKVYYLKLQNEKWSETDREKLSFISNERSVSVLRHKKDSDRRLSLFSALLVRHVLSEILCVPAPDLIFSHDRNQKPRLLSPSGTGLDFNFSHTQGAVLLGVTDHGSIGVDIESAARSVAPERFGKVFHPEEIAYINKTGENVSLRFFECWTRKEAYTKMLGTGLSCELSLINTFDCSIPAAFLTTRINDHICSICLSRKASESSVRLSSHDIISLSESDLL